MRAAFLGLTLLALVAAPAAGQEKTKSKGTAAPIATELYELCELFAKGDVLAVSTATEQGWLASETESDSIFVRAFDGSRSIEGVGEAGLFALLESYPLVSFGYCRIDIASPQAEVGVPDLHVLDWIEGDLQTIDTDTYGAWNGTHGGRDYLLLANQDELGFGLQLTIIDVHEDGQSENSP